MAPHLAIGAVVLGAAPRIVAAGGEADVEALVAADGADIVELRADLFDDPTVERARAALTRLRAGGRPIILTVRAADEGGRPLADDRRAALYDACLPLADAIDVEIASTTLATRAVTMARAAGKLVILSAHALAATPSADDLAALVRRGVARGADVVKLAAHAGGLRELRLLIAATLAAAPTPVVTLAMGPAGPLSRVVLPAAGSLLTYGHVGRPTAPGQLSVAELASLLGRLLP